MPNGPRLLNFRCSGINICFYTPLREKFFGRYEKNFLDATNRKGRGLSAEIQVRRMPRKSTGLTDRLTLPMKPELMREIDQVRGDVPRVAWIRRELALAVTRHRRSPRKRKRDGKPK